MKTFIPNKKWVMTGALLAVLGVNVSFTNHKFGLSGSADFASSSMEFRDEEIATAEGVQSIRYVQIEDNKVLALKKDTEGKVCYDCSERSFKLDNSNLKDIKQLNVKYLQTISKLPTPDTAKPTVEGEEETKTIASGILEKILASCEKKEGQTKLTCLSSKFLKALKEKKSAAISEEEASEFFRNELAPIISEVIGDARKISVQQARDQIKEQQRLHAMRNGNPWSLDSEFGDSDDDIYSSDKGDAESMLQAVLDSVKELHAGIPKKYSSIRQDLYKTQKQILEKHFQEVRKAASLAAQHGNTLEGNLYRLDALTLKNSMEYTAKEMSAATKDGLMDAYTADLITRAQRNADYDAYKLTANGIQNSMNTFWQQWNQTGQLPAGASVTPDFSSRTNVITRGNGVVVQQNLNQLTSSSTASAVPALDASGNLVWAIPTTNTVEFGTVVPLTDQNRMILQQMRQNQGTVIQRGN